MHKVVILLGSNIEPQKNISKAIHLLQQSCSIIKKSCLWETEAVGSEGPNFLNLAILLETKLSADELKNTVLQKIEQELERRRTANKNAPRTIDLDIIIYDDHVVDPNLWHRSFMALPVSEICPNLINPTNHKSLLQTADTLRNSSYAKIYDPNTK